MARKGKVTGKRIPGQSALVVQPRPTPAAKAPTPYKPTADDKARGRPNYLAADGSSCFSVTTILGQASDPEPLLFWANKLGWQRKSLRAGRTAADVGTAVHSVIEATVLGTLTDDPFDPAYNRYNQLPNKGKDEADSALAAFRAFWPGQGVKTLAVEFPMVHDRLRIGGCLDFLGMLLDRSLVIYDWKTSKATYPEMIAQAGAYALLVEEGRPNTDEPPELWPDFVGQRVEQALIVRLPKDSTDAEVTSLGPAQLALGREQFMGAYQTVMARLQLKAWLAEDKKRKTAAAKAAAQPKGQ
jgi:hypothetical protein